jgi:hypothetical protein
MKASFYFYLENLVLLGEVRDSWLCLRALCLKKQIPNTKLQINLKLNKSQIFTLLNPSPCVGPPLGGI